MKSFLHHRKTSFGTSIPKSQRKFAIPESHSQNYPHTQYGIQQFSCQTKKIYIRAANNGPVFSPSKPLYNGTNKKQYKKKENFHSYNCIQNNEYGIMSHMACNASDLFDIDLQTGFYILKKCIWDYLSISKEKKIRQFSLTNYWIGFDGVLRQKREKQAVQRLQNEQLVIIKMIEQVSKISSKRFQDFVKYFQRSSKNRGIGFKYLLSLINSYQDCSKIKEIPRIPERYLCSNSPNSTRKNSQTKGTSRKYFSDEKSSREQKFHTKIFTISECNNDKKLPKFLIDILKRQKIKNKILRNSIQIQYSFCFGINDSKICKISTTSTKVSDQHKKSLINAPANNKQNQKQVSLWKKLFSIQNNIQLMPFKMKDQQISPQKALSTRKSSQFPNNVLEVQSEGTMSEASLDRSYAVYSEKYEEEPSKQSFLENCMVKKIKRLINDQKTNQIRLINSITEEKYIMEQHNQ